MRANKRTLSQIAAHLDSVGLKNQIIGDPDAMLSLSSPASAGMDSLVFWFNGSGIPANIINIAISEKEYAKANSDKLTPSMKNLLVINGNIKLAFAYATHLFVDYGISVAKPGLSYIAPSAKVSLKAKISDFVHIGENSVIGDDCIIYPFSHIGDNVSIAEGTIIKPHSVILNDTVIGKYCFIESGAVIGGDGYGFVRDKDKVVKIEHLGRVVIGDFVEINANATIDKGTLDETVIGDYSKIDNLVQIAHNVRLGKGNFLAASSAIAGSSKLGDFNTLAGQAGVADNVSIGDNNMIAGKAGITKDTGSNQVLSGFPARPHKEELTRQANIGRIEKLADKIKDLEKEIENLKQQVNAKNDQK